ncbi:MAG: hypothetical protein QM635_01445 [Microbacteriaceae bacterium]
MTRTDPGFDDVLGIQPTPAETPAEPAGTRARARVPARSTKRAEPAEKRPRSWFGRIAEPFAWLHALVAALVGGGLSLPVRTLAIAAVVAQGHYLLFGALAVLAVTLAFGVLGRVFTGSRIGWFLLATVGLWLPAVGAVSFVVMTTTGSFNHFDPLIPGIGALVGATAALIVWSGPPRWIGVLGLLATSFAVVVIAF